MKPISLYVGESDYQQFKSLASKAGRPVSELIREAMSRYLEERSSRQPSLLELEPYQSGKLLVDWSRDELLDEMVSL